MIVTFHDGQCLGFPDDTIIEKDIPWHGWIQILSNKKKWWIQAQEVRYIGPTAEGQDGRRS